MLQCLFPNLSRGRPSHTRKYQNGWKTTNSSWRGIEGEKVNQRRFCPFLQWVSYPTGNRIAGTLVWNLFSAVRANREYELLLLLNPLLDLHNETGTAQWSPFQRTLCWCVGCQWTFIPIFMHLSYSPFFCAHSVIRISSFTRTYLGPIMLYSGSFSLQHAFVCFAVHSITCPHHIRSKWVTSNPCSKRVYTLTPTIQRCSLDLSH
jgi:hypothetical protein